MHGSNLIISGILWVVQLSIYFSESVPGNSRRLIHRQEEEGHSLCMRAICKLAIRRSHKVIQKIRISILVAALLKIFLAEQLIICVIFLPLELFSLALLQLLLALLLFP